MKFTHFQDRKGLLVGPRENGANSRRIQEMAFQNIMNEIIEHVVEGVCFEAHRAAKLGYFQMQDYVIKEHEFEEYNEEARPQKEPDSEEARPQKEPDSDIFGNKQTPVLETCPYCNLRKGAAYMATHLKKCRLRPNSSKVGNGKSNGINYEEQDSGDSDSFERKKGNDAKKQSKNAPSYDSMTQEEIYKFLMERCGVISSKTGKPCRNKLNCTLHSKDDRNEVRVFIFKKLNGHSEDGDIDIDTVD